MATSLCDIQWGPEGEEKTPLTVLVKMDSSPEFIKENLRVNMARDVLRFLDLPGLLYARHEPIALVGGGPSLNGHLDEIRKFRHVMACGSVHDHLVDMGVPFNFSLAVDPKEDAVNWFQKPQKDTSYLLASQCHPNLYAKLTGHKIAMWHLKGQVDECDEHLFNGEPQINWGPMVGNHAVQMALYLGFQELHFFGMDASHRDGSHHAYDVGKYGVECLGNKQVFKVNGKEFFSTTALISQMEHFFDIFASSDGQFLKGYVHNDDLWAEVIKASPVEMKEWLEVA
jgi:hypothetical protein